MATPQDLNLITLGLEGNVDISSHASAGPKQLPNMTVPLGLPPVLPDVQQELEEFLLHPEKLPIHEIDKAQRYWGRTTNVESLYSLDLCPLQTTITVDRNATTGHLIGFKEDVLPDTGSSAKNSTSLRRPPGPPSDGLRGSSTNYPFWPGGLDELPEIKLNNEENENIEDLDKNLLTVAPGLQKGIDFPNKSLGHIVKKKTEKVSFLKLTDLLNPDDEFDIEWHDEEKKDDSDENKASDVSGDVSNHEIDEIVKEDDKPKESVIELGSTKEVPKEFEFAVWVDLNTSVADFHKRIPDMAYKWPFELDVFQKQAILHLEQHDNVFVAAHTSAGKTVIAEYAIALSLKHMTKTIYTSPIKALSNQKFRDFKTTFTDVGLVTGDVQINQEASCLIMTTEILRSMLYNGSDVIRDLEWVIFDEVHYINDAERGVVWEEVLIMLPQHVNIILLSATVPNTMEFADWIGRTKKRKVYVVSTPKRPVPLEHYLYTGNSNKTSNEQFLLVDANSNFLTSGYNKAMEAKKERASKSSQSYGAKGPRGGHPLQDKNVWLSVIEMLRKKDKLPVVSFIFSKRKIEENSEHLKSVDLTTATEKSEIHLFIQRCISKLKGNDRELPQVKTMTQTLKRGIGIHHSGVLPILKEVVEMLFGKGLVKVLFATETFAMGVNMPARTVVFDSIRKHDGTALRDLLPGEYIQMAGRAGRRGLDTTGTVLILCKGDVPEMSDLHRMMLGRPTQLSSQFRLTYSMILNLLRVEELRVEDMMRRSFSEFHNQKDMTRRQGVLKVVEQQVEQMPDVVDYSGDLKAYYHCCDIYYSLYSELQKVVMSHPQTIKMLSPGRLVVVDTTKHKNSLGAILKVGSPTAKERTFTILVLSEQQDRFGDGDRLKKDPKNEQDTDTLMPKPYMKTPFFRPEGPCGHAVIDVKAGEICSITTKSLKLNADRIIDDVKKRQLPRFRNDPPGQSTSVATQELLRVVESNSDGLPAINPVKDLNLRDMDLVEQFRKLDSIEQQFEQFTCVSQPYFLENFEKLRSYMKLKEKYEDLKFQLSDASLQLLPEYHQRMEVLRHLGYIDSSHTVQLKGRVACEISQHELIITELVFENALTELHPTEIAAVLSSTVFEQRNASAANLSPRLEQCKESFKTVARKIGQVQKECGLLMPVEDYVDQFHFNLMEVVFEWARGMPFSEITALTDVQEGIIVRCIQRLDEVLRDVRNAARIIGDEILKQKMEEASDLIKRDIVFAASLYTQ